MPINRLAAKYNGGGHALASGAKAKNISQVKAIVKDLNQLAKNY